MLVLCACETASCIEEEEEEEEKKKQAEIAREFGAEEAIWSLKGRNDHEFTAIWRRLHNEELHDPYCSPNIYSRSLIKEGLMGGACSP